MNPSQRSSEPEFDGLPQALRKPAAKLRGLVRRLPTQPPSFVAARLLDRLLWPRLDAAQKAGLAGHTVEVELLETGVRVRLRLGGRGFEVAPQGTPAAIVIRARTAALLRLARGQDDADRLFFDRALVMEGDTELGLFLKNTLDAIGPLWAAAAPR
jgi:predicted lipid carrier protein YhbT